MKILDWFMGIYAMADKLETYQELGLNSFLNDVKIETKNDS